jgi:hypothetical protein
LPADCLAMKGRRSSKGLGGTGVSRATTVSTLGSIFDLIGTR